jgi:hypothetical protein
VSGIYDAPFMGRIRLKDLIPRQADSIAHVVEDDKLFPEPYTSPVATVARPDRDLFTGYDFGWLNESASNLNIYASLDETTASDTDYAESPEHPDRTEDAYHFRLEPMATPVPTGTEIAYRIGQGGADIDLDAVVNLYQGNLLIASWRESNVPDAPTTFTHALSAPEAASITDGTMLWMEVYAELADGGWYDDGIRSIGPAAFGNSVNIFVTMPKPCLPGDLLLAFFSGSNPATITAPDGWVEWYNVGSVRLFAKIAGVSEPLNYVFVQSVSGAFSSGALALKNAPNASLAVTGTPYSGGTLTYPLPAVTTTALNQIAIAFAVIGGNRSATVDAGFDEVIETVSTPTVYVATKHMPSIASTGTVTITWSTTGAGAGLLFVVDRGA